MQINGGFGKSIFNTCTHPTFIALPGITPIFAVQYMEQKMISWDFRKNDILRISWEAYIETWMGVLPAPKAKQISGVMRVVLVSIKKDLKIYPCYIMKSYFSYYIMYILVARVWFFFKKKMRKMSEVTANFACLLWPRHWIA